MIVGQERSRTVAQLEAAVRRHEENVQSEYDAALHKVFSRDAALKHIHEFQQLDPLDELSTQKVPLGLIETAVILKNSVSPPPPRIKPDCPKEYSYTDVSQGLALMTAIWSKAPHIPDTKHLVALVELITNKNFDPKLKYSYNPEQDTYDVIAAEEPQGTDQELILLSSLGSKGEDFIRRHFPHLITLVKGRSHITKQYAEIYQKTYVEYVTLLQQGYEPISLYAPDLQNPTDDQLRQRLSRAIRQKKIDGRKLFDMWLGKRSDILQFLDNERQQREQRKQLEDEGLVPITIYAPSLANDEDRKRRMVIARAARKGVFPSVKALDGTIWGPKDTLDHLYGDK